MSNDVEYLDAVSKPSNRFPHSAQFQILKAMGLGSIAGLGVYFVNKLMSQRNRKIVYNKYISQLPIDGLEGLGEEAEICENFHMLNVKQFRAYNPKAYQIALEKCSDLCYLAEKIAGGVLEESLPKIQTGEIDPIVDLPYDVTALHIWYDIHDNLQLIYNAVRDSEYKIVDERDQREENYRKAMTKWETDCLAWETRKLQGEKEAAEAKLANFNPMAFESETVTSTVVQEPQPPKPQKPPSEKLRTDFAEEYIEAVEKRTREVFHFIRASVERFRKKHNKHNLSRSSLNETKESSQ